MATGKYHKNNFLKFRILETFLVNKRKPMTSKQIADTGSIEIKKVLDALNHYIASDFGIIRRLPKKAKGGAYRYKLTERGEHSYWAYRRRIELGVDLNRLRRVPKKVDSYMGYTKAGAEANASPHP